MSDKYSVGKSGEDIASDFLRKKNYKIIEQNFKKRYGEIDIVALDGETLVFVEVKTRKSTEFGSPLEAITPWKLSSVIKTAQYYKLTHPKLPDLMRIDAVAIKLFDDGRVEEIELVKNISGF